MRQYRKHKIKMYNTFLKKLHKTSAALITMSEPLLGKAHTSDREVTLKKILPNRLSNIGVVAFCLYLSTNSGM